MDDILLEDYCPRWPAQFDTEAARLQSVLGSGSTLAVEHIGSTAVPGLRAKPVIDIAIAVPDLQKARDNAVPALETLGYAFWADNPNVHRLFFVKGLPPNGPRTHHVHIAEPGTLDPRTGTSGFWDKILFRNALRADPNLAARYQELKRMLSEAHKNDREAYTDGKTEFILSVLEQVKSEPCQEIKPFIKS